MQINLWSLESTDLGYLKRTILKLSKVKKEEKNLFYRYYSDRLLLYQNKKKLCYYIIDTSKNMCVFFIEHSIIGQE